MSGFSHKNGVMYADSVSLHAIAEQVGTPTYVYSASLIRAQYKKLKDAVSKDLPHEKHPLLCFACKANSHLATLTVLKNIGSGLEIVSEGELVRALKAGIDPQKIVSTGVGKQKSEIAALLKAGIYRINVESLPELYMINKIAGEMEKTARVALRYNPNVSGGGHDKISTGRIHDKFGVDTAHLKQGFAESKEMDHISLTGISMHIGSQVFTVDSFREAFQKLPALVYDLRADGHTIDSLDIGGGFPIAYQDDQGHLDLDAYAQWVREIIMPLDAQIIMEPGRFMVGNAGILLSEVLYIKETTHRDFMIIDAAMNDLVRPAMYDAWHTIEPVAALQEYTKLYDVVGPVCESSDMFAKDRNMPVMHAGDLIAIKSAGAYGFSMASNYNTRRLPAEVMVDGENMCVIRPRQSFDDIMNAEVIPDWL